MPTNIHQRAPGPGTQLVGLLAAIRWEAQFKLAKCCMHASKSISDLGVFLAEPVLERSKALNDTGAQGYFADAATGRRKSCKRMSS